MLEITFKTLIKSKLKKINEEYKIDQRCFPDAKTTLILRCQSHQP